MRRRHLLAVLALCACKGPPAILRVASAVVENGRHAKIQIRVEDAKFKSLVPDGKLSVVWVDASGTERCRGEGVADPKNAWDNGGPQVQVEFDTDHVCTPKRGTTQATFTFEPRAGGKVTDGPSDFMTGLDDWDASNVTAARYAAEAEAGLPKLVEELARLSAVAKVLVPPADDAPPPKCPDAVAGATVESVFWDDVAAFTAHVEPSPVVFDKGRGFYAVLSSYRDSPKVAASDPRSTDFRPARFLEVYKVSRYSPVRRLGDGKFEGGGVWGQLFIVDLDQKKVVCHAPLEAGPGDKVVFTNDGFEREALAQMEASWVGRRGAAEVQMAGVELKHGE